MSGCGELLMAGTSTWSAGQSIGKMITDYQYTGKINPWDAVNATMNLGMALAGTFAAVLQRQINSYGMDYAGMHQKSLMVRAGYGNLL